jgi:hypothetical protein
MVAYNQIPSSLRTPFVAVEFDNSRAAKGPALLAYRALLIGQKIAAGHRGRRHDRQCTSEKQAATLCGRGSQLHLMARAWFKVNKSTELWLLVLADNGAGVAATKTITVTGRRPRRHDLALHRRRARAGGRRERRRAEQRSRPRSRGDHRERRSSGHGRGGDERRHHDREEQGRRGAGSQRPRQLSGRRGAARRRDDRDRERRLRCDEPGADQRDRRDGRHLVQHHRRIRTTTRRASPRSRRSSPAATADAPDRRRGDHQHARHAVDDRDAEPVAEQPPQPDLRAAGQGRRDVSVRVRGGGCGGDRAAGADDPAGPSRRFSSPA